MKIQFCDLCNESVPQSDLDEGRAFIRKGRVVCATCDRAMSHPGAELAADSASHAVGHDTPAFGTPVQHSAVSLAIPGAPGVVALDRTAGVQKSSAGLWVAVLAMAFTAGAIYVQNRRLEEAARENRDTRELCVRTQQELVDNLRRVQAEFPRILREEEGHLNARIDAERRDTDSKLGQFRDDGTKQLSEVQAAVKNLGAWRDDAGAQSQEDKKRLVELSQRLAKSEDDARQLVERMQTLEQAAKAPPPPPVVLVGKNEPAWKSLLVDLTSANAGVRWEAVDGLGQARDPQAVPSLLPMLKDPDVFVRMATARVLGDLKATSAVPGLLDALEDNEDAVREAAFVALRSIAGNKDIKFDPLAPEAERAKRLKALREWWKKEEESAVGRG